jgi:hypothetical protein
MSAHPHDRGRFMRVWGWPLFLALSTGSGLVSGLVSDGWGDVWSWVGLGLPTAVIAWFGWRPRADQ